MTDDVHSNLMFDNTSHIVVTGYTGYIGQRFVTHALRLGISITVLGRRKSKFVSDKIRFFPWSFGSPVPSEAFILDTVPAMALVHLAHQWNGETEEHSDPNITATAEILGTAREAGVKNIVVASSISARQQALNRYGRVKWQIENLLRGDNEKAARIGLVYGGPLESQWGQLVRMTSISPILPMIAPQTLVQPIHLDELSEGLMHLAAGLGPNKQVVGLASNNTVSFGYFLRQLRKARLQKPLIIIPIPVTFALILVEIFNCIPMLPKVSRDKVLGLASLQAIDTEDDLKALNLFLEPVSTGLFKGTRRALIREGYRLLYFILNETPSVNEIKTYVKGLELHGVFHPLDFPFCWKIIPNNPIRRTYNNSELRLEDRLYIAALVAECGRGKNNIFYRYTGIGRVGVVLIFLGLALREILLAPLRAVLIMLAHR